MLGGGSVYFLVPGTHLGDPVAMSTASLLRLRRHRRVRCAICAAVVAGVTVAGASGRFLPVGLLLLLVPGVWCGITAVLDAISLIRIGRELAARATQAAFPVDPDAPDGAMRIPLHREAVHPAPSERPRSHP